MPNRDRIRAALAPRSGLAAKACGQPQDQMNGRPTTESGLQALRAVPIKSCGCAALYFLIGASPKPRDISGQKKRPAKASTPVATGKASIRSRQRQRRRDHLSAAPRGSGRRARTHKCRFAESLERFPDRHRPGSALRPDRLDPATIHLDRATAGDKIDRRHGITALPQYRPCLHGADFLIVTRICRQTTSMPGIFLATNTDMSHAWRHVGNKHLWVTPSFRAQRALPP